MGICHARLFYQEMGAIIVLIVIMIFFQLWYQGAVLRFSTIFQALQTASNEDVVATQEGQKNTDNPEGNHLPITKSAVESLMLSISKRCDGR